MAFPPALGILLSPVTRRSSPEVFVVRIADWPDWGSLVHRVMVQVAGAPAVEHRKAPLPPKVASKKSRPHQAPV